MGQLVVPVWDVGLGDVAIGEALDYVTERLQREVDGVRFSLAFYVISWVRLVQPLRASEVDEGKLASRDLSGVVVFGFYDYSEDEMRPAREIVHLRRLNFPGL